MNTAPAAAPEQHPVWEPLPGRREALLHLAECIPGFQQQMRTDIHGIVGAWQPTDFLPDFTDEERGFEKVRAIQRQARLLPPELLVVLIGDTVTEEILPTPTSNLFTMYGLPTGETSDVHAHRGNIQQWFQKWSSEENRHGDVLKEYLRYTGRVDMKAFERTVQLCLQDGMDVRVGNDPFRAFVYTSFQELATQRSHANVAKLAKRHGNPLLAEICGQIAADEGYHAKAYMQFVRTFFERNPNEMMQALGLMLERGIVMPAHNMREVDPSGRVLQPGETYAYFSNIAEQLGVYTAKDYAEISGELLTAWDVGRRTKTQWEALPFQGLEEHGAEAQQRILRRQRLIERLACQDRKKELPPYETSWLVRKAS